MSAAKALTHPHSRGPALEDLFRTHHAYVCRVVAGLGIPAEAVEDVAQEVFIVVSRKLPSYDERGSMRGWLAAIARGVAADHRKKEGRAQARRQHLPRPSESPDPELGLAQLEAAEVVERFLAALSEEQRTVFVFMELEGLSGPEVARALELELNTVYSRLRLARRRFEGVCEAWQRDRDQRQGAR